MLFKIWEVLDSNQIMNSTFCYSKKYTLNPTLGITHHWLWGVWVRIIVPKISVSADIYLRKVYFYFNPFLRKVKINVCGRHGNLYILMTIYKSGSMTVKWSEVSGICQTIGFTFLRIFFSLGIGREVENRKGGTVRK